MLLARAEIAAQKRDSGQAVLAPAIRTTGLRNVIAGYFF